MRWLLLALAMMTLAGPVAAQPTVVAAQATDALTRGLVAQYEAALIRERRLADDRETRLIAEYEQRLTRTRTQADARAAGAETALAQARQEYASLVGGIVRRNGDARQLSVSYQDQVLRDITQSSPEQLAALQRFADGDQTAGFDQFQAESRRRSAARQAAAQAAVRAADAADARQLASMGETMRLNGRKSIADVIALYEAATQLDPDIVAPWIVLARLDREAGRLDASRRAAERGLFTRLAAVEYADLNSPPNANTTPTNATPLEQADLRLELGRTISDMGRPEHARAEFELARDLMRQVAGANSADAGVQQRLGASLYRLADWLSHHESGAGPEAALQAGEESATILRRLSAADPSNTSMQRDLGYALEMLGDAQLHLENWNAARASHAESLAIRRRLGAADPANPQAQRDIAMSLIAIGSIKLREGDAGGARTDFAECLAISRRLAANDPNDAQAQSDVAWSLERLGAAQLGGRDLTGARASLMESLSIRRRLAASSPGSAEAQRDVSRSLDTLSDLQRAEGDVTSAAASHEESAAIARRIAQDFPDFK